jgi:peptidoglycan/LPS O-acetylase OafA/YrhL
MTKKLTHRREIQGLRALAVLAVITNHLFADFLPGGFLGVDIFFVLSGYLITGQLVELSTNGQLGRNLLNFYSRRMRRILPSALLVIWVSVGLAFRYLGPVIGNETLRDGRWSTLFIANSHFNSLKVDYFGQGVSSPLLQHYWSLAVEEQFYIVWPIVLLLFVLLSKTHSKKILSTFLSAIAVFSFSSIFELEKTLTYFATQTRIWELSIGALIAILGARAWQQFLQWVAFLILLASLFLVGSTNQVPGPIIAPALIAVVVLLNVSNANLQFLLGNRLMHYVGDLSFVLYLWHWPVIELHRQLANTPLSTGVLISLLVITFILAIITHHFFENPIRFNKYLVLHPGVTVISGTIAITMSVLASYLLVKGSS